MKKFLLFLGLPAVIMYCSSLYPAAYSRTSSHHNGSFNSSFTGSRLKRSTSSSSTSFYEPGRPLTPLEYERLNSTIRGLDKKIIDNIAQHDTNIISINDLIDFLTDAYLGDAIAGEVLDHLRHKLITRLRIKRIRNRLDEGFFALSPQEEILQNEEELAALPENALEHIIVMIEKIHNMPPITEVIAQELIPLTTPEHLTQLIDHAMQGTLANYLTPLQFLELVHNLNTEEQTITLEQRNLIDTMTIASVNHNLKNNPTYSLIRNNQKQNELLQESEKLVDEYYMLSGRQRPGASMPAKKSFSQRWFTRRKK